MSRLSGGGLLVFGLTVTFAVVDWTMSVNPHWFSTMWGLLYIVGQGLSALAFAIAVLVMLSKQAPLDRVVNPSHLHDLGKLLFAFIMLWAYLSFSQFIIIYSANTAEEIPHYWVRAQNGWQWIGWALVAFHFVLPYVLLLSRDIKRDWRRLSVIASFVVGHPAARLLLARRAGIPHRRAVALAHRHRAADRAGRRVRDAVRDAVEGSPAGAAAGRRAGQGADPPHALRGGDQGPGTGDRG